MHLEILLLKIYIASYPNIFYLKYNFRDLSVVGRFYNSLNNTCIFSPK